MAVAQHEADVNVNLDLLYNTILDFASYPKFSTGVKSTRIVATQQAGMQVEMDLELIKRIQYVIDVHFEKSPSSAKIWWTLQSGDLFKKNNGSWELKKIDDKNTHVLYSLDVEFNFSVPGFILKNLIKKSLPAAVEDFANESIRRIK